MLQIKTIALPVDVAALFDEKVNAAIAEGWVLNRRDVVLPHNSDTKTFLYAELSKVVITEKERCCENCKYGDEDPNHSTCRNCEDGPNGYPTNWEACDD